MAAGVPAAKLYPLDIDKAFASYDEIKKAVVKWWIPARADPASDRPRGRHDNRLERSHGGVAGGERSGGHKLGSGLMKRDAWASPKAPRTP